MLVALHFGLDYKMINFNVLNLIQSKIKLKVGLYYFRVRGSFVSGCFSSVENEWKQAV